MKECGGASNCSSAFAIRDDDVSYFTSSSILETLYEHAWKLRFKVSLAVIPKRESSGTKFSVSRNKELVRYLRTKIEEDSVNIVQHGYAHSNIGSEREFAMNDFQKVNNMLVKGRRILEKTFRCRISVFTAPHDAVSRATLRSIERNKMCLCRRFTLGRLLMIMPPVNLRLSNLVKVILSSRSPFQTLPRSVIRITEMPIIQWNAYFSPKLCIGDQIEKAKKLVLRSKDQNEPFVLLQHHWEYFGGIGKKSGKISQIDFFNSFLDFLVEQNIKKVSLSDLCECFLQ